MADLQEHFWKITSPLIAVIFHTHYTKTVTQLKLYHTNAIIIMVNGLCPLETCSVKVLCSRYEKEFPRWQSLAFLITYRKSPSELGSYTFSLWSSLFKSKWHLIDTGKKTDFISKRSCDESWDIEILTILRLVFESPYIYLDLVEDNKRFRKTGDVLATTCHHYQM